jgi:hypothetical protein
VSVNLKELAMIGQCLNDVCHGFRISDFAARIGSDKTSVVKLLDQIVAMYPSRLKA